MMQRIIEAYEVYEKKTKPEPVKRQPTRRVKRG